LVATDASLEHGYARQHKLQSKQKRCIDIYQYMREVCSTKLLSAPIILGGPGTVVQIDESLFAHNRKVGTNHFSFPYTSFYPVQNGRGRRPPQKQWVFGMVDTFSTPALGYMELVQDRTAATIIIAAHVAPGMEVWSDQWVCGG